MIFIKQLFFSQLGKTVNFKSRKHQKVAYNVTYSTKL